MEKRSIIKNKFIESTNKTPVSLLADMYYKYGIIFDCNDGKIVAIRQEHKDLKCAV